MTTPTDSKPTGLCSRHKPGTEPADCDICFPPMNPPTDSEIDQLISEGLRLAEAATPGPITVKNDVHVTGLTLFQQRVEVTSPNKPNASYRDMPGIVAMLQSRISFGPHKSLSDEDAALWQFAGTHLRTLLLALAADRRQREELVAKWRERADRYDALPFTDEVSSHNHGSAATTLRSAANELEATMKGSQ